MQIVSLRLAKGILTLSNSIVSLALTITIITIIGNAY